MKKFEYTKIDFNVQMFWRAALELGIGFDSILEALNDSPILNDDEFINAAEKYRNER